MAVLYVRIDDGLDAEVSARAAARGMSKNAWAEQALARALEGEAMGDAAAAAEANRRAASDISDAAAALEEASKSLALLRRDAGRASQAALASLMLECWTLGPALDLLGAEDGPAAALAELPMDDAYRMFWRCAGALRRDPAPRNFMAAFARLSEYLPDADIEELTGYREDEWADATRPYGAAAEGDVD